MSDTTVTIHVPYVENERLFLLQAVEVAMRTFRRINANPGDDLGKESRIKASHVAMPSPAPKPQARDKARCASPIEA